MRNCWLIETEAGAFTISLKLLWFETSRLSTWYFSKSSLNVCWFLVKRSSHTPSFIKDLRTLNIGFAAPAFNGFDLLYGPSKATTQDNTIYSFVLRAKSVGSFVITTASAKIGTTVVNSSTKSIRVIDNSPQSNFINPSRERKTNYAKMKMNYCWRLIYENKITWVESPRVVHFPLVSP